MLQTNQNYLSILSSHSKTDFIHKSIIDYDNLKFYQWIYFFHLLTFCRKIFIDYRNICLESIIPTLSMWSKKQILPLFIIITFEVISFFQKSNRRAIFVYSNALSARCTAPLIFNYSLNVFRHSFRLLFPTSSMMMKLLYIENSFWTQIL